MSAPRGPHETDLIEQFRQLALSRDGASQPASAHTPPVTLVDVERLARLHAIVHNPYHQRAFGHLSNVEMMRICAYNLLANNDGRNAARAFREIERIEAQQAKTAKLRADRRAPKPVNDDQPSPEQSDAPPRP